MSMISGLFSVKIVHLWGNQRVSFIDWDNCWAETQYVPTFGKGQHIAESKST